MQKVLTPHQGRCGFGAAARALCPAAQVAKRGPLGAHMCCLPGLASARPNPWPVPVSAHRAWLGLGRLSGGLETPISELVHHADRHRAGIVIDTCLRSGQHAQWGRGGTL